MRALLPFVLIFAAASSFATEFVPQRHGSHLGARIQGSPLPGTFRRDLTSGLTNRLLIRLTLRQAARELHTRSVEIAIKYDLWDEQFTMTTRLDGVVVNTSVSKDVQQVIDTLQAIDLPELFPLDAAPAGSEVIMKAVVLINPIDRARMDAIKEWVAQNSGRGSLDPAEALSAGDISVSNAIFNRIFEQYASGAEQASAWQQELVTKPFRLDRLPHESR